MYLYIGDFISKECTFHDFCPEIVDKCRLRLVNVCEMFVISFPSYSDVIRVYLNLQHLVDQLLQDCSCAKPNNSWL